MKFCYLFFIIIFSVSCSKKKVYLIKQWHLSPNERTKNIIESQKLPQYLNQLDIYHKTEKLIKEGSKTVIAEGCESRDKYIKSTFNGWTYSDLVKSNEEGNLEQVLAPVPLKIHVKYQDKVNLVCGDNSELIKKNNLAFSDMKGLSGFFYRLQMYQNNDNKKYKKYLKAFKEIADVKPGTEPVELARDKTLEALSKFKNYIEQRNYSFVKSIIKTIDDNPILIVGGLHIPGIEKLLKEEEIEYEVITPFNYPADEEKLVLNLERALRLYEGKKVVFNQVPVGFTDKLFPYGYLIKPSDLANKNELTHLEGILDEYEIDKRILFSDLDKDGTRDFTISKNKEILVISAEDNDWDNDGKVNLEDNTIGNVDLFKIDKDITEFSNAYDTKGIKLNELKEEFSKAKIKLINQESKHDILILKTFSELLKKFSLSSDKLKTFVATKPKIQYGKQVFFSYIKQSKSLEVYPDKLLNYLASKKRDEFNTVKMAEYVNGVVIPIIIHSLFHEIAHSKEPEDLEFFKKYGWSWKEKSIDSTYLVSFREKTKNLSVVLSELTYKKLTYEQWLNQNQLYITSVNNLIKEKLSDEDFQKKAKSLKWFTQTVKMEKQFQLSFLVSQNIPSIYSLSSPKEWFAEVFAGCLFTKLYPQALKPSEAIRYELLIGFNPKAMHDEFCQ